MRDTLQKFRESFTQQLISIREEISFHDSENVKLFTYVTVIFLPLGFATGVFSMSDAPQTETLRSMAITALVALTLTATVLINAKTLVVELFKPTRDSFSRLAIYLTYPFIIFFFRPIFYLLFQPITSLFFRLISFSFVRFFYTPLVYLFYRYIGHPVSRGIRGFTEKLKEYDERYAVKTHTHVIETEMKKARLAYEFHLRKVEEGQGAVRASNSSYQDSLQSSESSGSKPGFFSGILRRKRRMTREDEERGSIDE